MTATVLSASRFVHTPAPLQVASRLPVPDDGDGPEHRMTHALDVPPAEPVAFPMPTKGARPRARLLTVSDVPLERVNWLWDQHVPMGMLTLIGGRPGAGKSSLAVAISATVTRGGHWPDGSRCATQGDVLYWTSEDAPGVIRARAQASGADLSRLHLVAGDANGNAFDPAHHSRQLDAALELLPDARAIVFDPIINAVSTDTHKAGEVRRALAPLLDVASRRNIAIVGITHFRKGSDADDPVERLIGSGAFGALARCVWLATKDVTQAGQTHDRLFALAKCNIAHDERAWRYGLYREPLADGIEGQAVNWGDSVAGSARELLAKAEAVPGDDGPGSGDPDAELIALLQAQLADGPRSPGDVISEAVAAGFNRHRIDRVKARAGVQSFKQGMGGGWLWRLREDRSPSQALQPSQPSQSSQPSSFQPFSRDGEGVGA